MGIFYNTVRARVHLDRIRENYELLDQAGGNAMPVIKSDAYGHGLEEVARVLAKPKGGRGAQTLAAGTVNECVRLRESGFSGRIVSLLGPQDRAEAEVLPGMNIVPFVYRYDQLMWLDEISGKGPVDVALKFETGMSRLGFSVSEADRVVETMSASRRVRPVMVCSHLATADEPESREFVMSQGQGFLDVLSKIAGLAVEKAAPKRPQAVDVTHPAHPNHPAHPYNLGRRNMLPGLEACLANTAALLAYPELRFDLQRPGIGLYGANPFHETSLAHLGEKLKPAMDVYAPVIQVRDVAKGQGISYGRTYVADKDMRVAVVAIGYADCYTRSLSSGPLGSRAAMLVQGSRAPVLGRVCMQMTLLDVTRLPQVKVGDSAYVLGGAGAGAIKPEELSEWWGTIPYEVFCLLGMNEKEYVGG